MPFGTTNAPATFQRLMHDCLKDLNMRWCIVYLDDIIILSDTKEDNLKRLEAVFQKLAAAGLKLKPSKCFIFREEIEYLEILEFLYFVEKFLANIFQKFFHYNTKSESSRSESSEEENREDSTQRF